MHPRGHAGLTMVAFAPLLFVHHSPTSAIPFVIVAVLFSITPDVDIFDVSVLSVLAHRGQTHTVWFMIGVFVLASAILLPAASVTPLTPRVSVLLAVSASVGVGTHLLADTVTKAKGLQLLTPILNREYHIPVVSSTSQVNNILFVAGAGLTFLVYV